MHVARFAAVLFLVPLSLEAATHAARNRCSDVVRILRSGSQHYRNREVTALEAKGAETHYQQVMENWQRAGNALKQVPKGELDPKDPELSECVAIAKDWGLYINDLRKKIDAAGKSAEVLAPFLEAVKGKEQGFWTLAAVQYLPSANALNATPPADARRWLSELSDVESICQKNYPDPAPMPAAKDPSRIGGSVMRVGGVEMQSDLQKSPAAWCHVARNRTALMTQASANRFVKVEGYGNYSLLLPETIKKLSVDSPFLEAWMAEILLKPAEFQTKRREASASWYQAVGIAQPEASSDSIAEQLKQLSAVVDQVAPLVKFSAAGPHDAGLETRAKASLARIFPQAKVRGSVMDEAGWTIEKNGLGIPLSRFRSGQIVFARPETKWCLQRTFNYVEQYAGGGSYAPGPQVNILPMTKFVTCP